MGDIDEELNFEAFLLESAKKAVIEDFGKNVLGIKKKGQNFKVDERKVAEWYNKQIKTFK